MAENTDLLQGSVKEFIESVAAKTPTPGGGSVAGVVGALGVALSEMALNFTRGKKKFAEHEALYAAVAQRFAKARTMFADLMADDMEAFQLYQSSTRLPDGQEKDQAVQLATAAAIDVPREMAKLALAALADMRSLADKCNPYLVSDLVAGAALASAVVRLCDYNVRMNVPNVADRQAATEIALASRTDVARANNTLDEIEKALAPQGG